LKLEIDKKEISQNLLSEIRSDIKKTFQSAYGKKYIYTVKIDTLTEVIAYDDYINFKINFSVNSPDLSYSSNRDDLDLQFRSPQRVDTLKSGEIFYNLFLCRTDTSNDIYGKDFNILFPHRDFRSDQINADTSQYLRFGQFGQCGILLISQSLERKIRGYSDALRGFPWISKGGYGRMFYLSAITITTVGFGDIVPISPNTRTAISIEAIWGVILIGLFLNSLAQKIYGKK
jgi:hypothetical protein